MDIAEPLTRRSRSPRREPTPDPVGEHAPAWQTAVDRLSQLSDQGLDSVVARGDVDLATAAGQPDSQGSHPLHAPTPAEPTDR